MIHLDLFSGIGGFSLGLKKVFNIKKTYFSEIDKYAIEVFKYNFKKSIYAGPVEDIQKRDLPKINIITFGSPCQDFSLAGKRKGMDGKRSSLILEAIRLIKECKPDFFIWENVKGTFSSNSGEDFAGILQAFTNIGGYRLEWQLLNTRWFLPQNRERIYLVGCSGKGSGKGIFPIGEINKNDEKMEVSGRPVCKSLTARGQSDLHSGLQLVNVVKKDKNKNIVSEKIRRLTPVECERFQGFPDNWTKKGKSGNIPDKQRYKMCGNAVTVDVVEAVAKNIKASLI